MKNLRKWTYDVQDAPITCTKRVHDGYLESDWCSGIKWASPGTNSLVDCSLQDGLWLPFLPKSNQYQKESDQTALFHEYIFWLELTMAPSAENITSTIFGIAWRRAREKSSIARSPASVSSSGIADVLAVTFRCKLPLSLNGRVDFLFLRVFKFCFVWAEVGDFEPLARKAARPKQLMMDSCALASPISASETALWWISDITFSWWLCSGHTRSCYSSKAKSTTEKNDTTSSISKGFLFGILLLVNLRSPSWMSLLRAIQSGNGISK